MSLDLTLSFSAPATWDHLASRLGDSEECVSDMEDRIMEIMQSEGQTERQIKKK